MTLKNFLKKLLCHSCCYFSVCILLYIIIAAIMNVDDERLLLDAGRTVLFFVFSLLLALANNLLTLKSFSGKLKLILHYLLTAFAFYSCFMLPLSLKASGILIGLVVFTVVYFAVCGIVTLFKSKYRRNTEKTEAYSKQFSKGSK